MKPDHDRELLMHPFEAVAPSRGGGGPFFPHVPRGEACAAPPSAARSAVHLGEVLNAEGTRWLRSMPVSVRPLITAKRHPHIVNRLALLWGDADAVAAYMDSLLISTRPGRRGFAPEVLSELCDLQNALFGPGAG